MFDAMEQVADSWPAIASAGPEARGTGPNPTIQHGVWLCEPGEDGESLPVGLEEIAPGPALAALLSGVEVDRLSGLDRLRVLQAHQRLSSHYQAVVFDNMASVVDAVIEEDEVDIEAPLGLSEAAGAAAAEIRVALTLTRRAADRELEVALELRRRLPRVADALRAGRIDRRRAIVLLEATRHLPVGEARSVVGGLIDNAGGLTTGQLRARLQRLAMEVAPDAAAARYRSGLEDRHVVLAASDDGTAVLSASGLSPSDAAGARRRIEDLARSLNGPREPRSLDQLRADVFIDLLSDSPAPDDAVTARRGSVQLTVDLATLADLDDKPGELGGYGPVIADVARQTALAQRRARWRFVVTDPHTGATVATGTTRRRPSRSQRTQVESRDSECIFPGCRMAAVECDLDHRVRYADGGLTDVDALVALCRHDHSIRHKHGWRHESTRDGGYLWTSPLGQVVEVRGGVARRGLYESPAGGRVRAKPP